MVKEEVPNPQLIKELEEAHRRIAELEDAEVKRQQMEVALRRSEERYYQVYKAAPVALVVWDRDCRIIDWNVYAQSLFGWSREEVLGQDFFRFLIPEGFRPVVTSVVKALLRGEVQAPGVNQNLTKSGEIIMCEWSHAILRERNDQVAGCISMGLDVTSRRRAQEIITRQAEEILEISTPVVQVWEGILAAVLIGTLDSRRTEQFTEKLLNRIVETNSLVTLVDITGVPAIDTNTAQHLIESICAVRLLGTKVVLTGVRPAIAQTLVRLGIDLADVVTRSSLAAGLKVALNTLEMEMVKKPKKWGGPCVCRDYFGNQNPGRLAGDVSS